jgi:hypothetical protein
MTGKPSKALAMDGFLRTLTLNPKNSMKTLRFLLALTGASLLLSGYAFAADKDQPKDQDKPKAACDCGKDKDGKVCGVDKDCCCTGAKATKTDTKADTKQDQPKPDQPKQDEPKKT